jgi:hypothetical protein
MDGHDTANMCRHPQLRSLRNFMWRKNPDHRNGEEGL